MADYYLKATDEAALYAALAAVGLVDKDRNPIGIALDVIGTISQSVLSLSASVPGVSADLSTAPQPIAGCHANLRGELTAAQQAKLPLIGAPTTPFRTWA